jgi:hypothetical protein
MNLELSFFHFLAKPLRAANLPHIGGEFIDVIKYVGVLKI